VSNPGSLRSCPPASPGRLLVGATPLGQPSDASARLVSALGSADVIAAEDTRRIRNLAQALDVRLAGKVVSLFDQNEASRVPALVGDVQGGATVLLVSDAGMPLISDPGYRLVAACVDAGLPVHCLPGPSAVTTALVLAGFPVDRFCFEGFAPRRGGERRRWLATLETEPRAVVFFEAPHRLAETLEAAVEVLGPERGAAVCRELTKKYEEVRRGTLAELAEGAVADPVRGEVTVVLAGATPTAPDVGSLVGAVRERVAGGERLKDAAAAVAAAAGVPRRELYNAALAARD
jgi:16S rRNA (cytidine1402-2'-O)-methyltransferase